MNLNFLSNLLERILNLTKCKANKIYIVDFKEIGKEKVKFNVSRESIS